MIKICKVLHRYTKIFNPSVIYKLLKHTLLTIIFCLCFLYCEAQKYRDAYANGNYKKSLTLAQKTLDKDKSALDAYLFKAMSNLYLGLDSITHEDYPTGVESSLTTITFLINKDKKKEFIPLHQTEIDIITKEVFLLAEEYYNSERTVKSEKLLDKLLEIDAKPEYFYLKGKILSEKGETDQAAINFNQAAAKIYLDYKAGKINEPYLSDAFVQLAYSIYDDRDYPNAYTIFNRAQILYQDVKVEEAYYVLLDSQLITMQWSEDRNIFENYIHNLDTISGLLKSPEKFHQLKWKGIITYYNALRYDDDNIAADSLLEVTTCAERHFETYDFLVENILNNTRIDLTVTGNPIKSDLNACNTYKKIYNCMHSGAKEEDGLYQLVDSLIAINQFTNGIKILYNIRRLNNNKTKISSYENKIYTILKNSDSTFLSAINLYDFTVYFPENKSFSLLQQNEAVIKINAFIEKNQFTEAGILLRQQIKIIPNNATIQALYRKWIIRDYTKSYLSSYEWTDKSEWNGSDETCTPGKVSPKDQEKFLICLNYVRRLAGIPDACILREEWNTKCQAAALMMTANYDLSHNPPKDWSCYTEAGYEGASNSNLSLGYDGIPALMGQVDDDGGNNSSVGHRRWILNPYRKVFGHGSTGSAMALWALGGKDSNYPDEITDKFDAQYVVWPPEYYCPKSFNCSRWSFSLSNAYFDSVSVEVYNGKKKIACEVLETASGYGQNTLVFVPQFDSYYMSAETTITVKIKNVKIYEYDAVKDEYVYKFFDYTYYTTFIETN